MNKKIIYILLAILIVFVIYKIIVYKFMSISSLKIRGEDNFGSGAYGASRGTRKHQGVDLVTAENQSIYSSFTGVVKRTVTPYASGVDSNVLSGIEIIGTGVYSDYVFKIFYLKPSVAVGFSVGLGTKIGNAQTLQNRYKGITNHIHIEIRRNGILINPKDVI